MTNWLVATIEANLEDLFPQVLAIAKQMEDNCQKLGGLAEIALPKMAINVNENTKTAFTLAVRNIMKRGIKNVPKFQRRF